MRGSEDIVVIFEPFLKNHFGRTTATNAPNTAYFLAVAWSLLLPLAGVKAQDTTSMNWPSQCGDACNSSSTSAVPLNGLNILWEKPATTWTNPRVWVNSNLQQLIISGSFIYDAATGQLLATLPYEGLFSAVTSTAGRDILLTTRLVSGMPGGGDEVCKLLAYDISIVTQATGLIPIWQIETPSPGSVIDGIPEINSKNETFYIRGNYGIAAVDAITGDTLGQSAVQRVAPERKCSCRSSCDCHSER